VMCVVFKGKPTHHLIVPNSEGMLTINKKTFKDAKTLKDLITALRQKQPGWPVALVKPIKNGKGSASKPVAAGAAPKAKVKKSSVSSTTSSGGKKDSSKKSLKKKSPAWLHGPISKEEADELLLAHSKEDGTYLVRSREGKKTEFVLGVIFKGKPTHHLIKKDEGMYKINNKAYGEHSKVSQLIELLQKKGTPKWPVPLTNPVPSPTAAKAANEKASAAVAEELIQ
jgi:hypothetical protein